MSAHSRTDLLTRTSCSTARGATVHMRRHPRVQTCTPGTGGASLLLRDRTQQVHVPDMLHTCPESHWGEGGGPRICPPQRPLGKSSRIRAQHLSSGVVRSLRQGLSPSQLYLCIARRDTVDISEQPSSQVMDVVNKFTSKREMEKGIGLTHSFLLFIVHCLATRLFSRNT